MVEGEKESGRKRKNEEKYQGSKMGIKLSRTGDGL